MKCLKISCREICGNFPWPKFSGRGATILNNLGKPNVWKKNNFSKNEKKKCHTKNDINCSRLHYVQYIAKIIIFFLFLEDTVFNQVRINLIFQSISDLQIFFFFVFLFLLREQIPALTTQQIPALTPSQIPGRFSAIFFAFWWTKKSFFFSTKKWLNSAVDF